MPLNTINLSLLVELDAWINMWIHLFQFSYLTIRCFLTCNSRWYLLPELSFEFSEYSHSEGANNNSSSLSSVLYRRLYLEDLPFFRSCFLSPVKSSSDCSDLLESLASLELWFSSSLLTFSIFRFFFCGLVSFFF